MIQQLAADFSVRELCQTYGVSRHGYDRWKVSFRQRAQLWFWGRVTMARWWQHGDRDFAPPASVCGWVGLFLAG